MYDDKQLNEIIFRYEDDYWWYVARQEIIGKFLEKHCRPGMKLLNVGSGTGANSRFASLFADVFSLDLSMHALRLSRKKIQAPLICASALEIPFKSDSFDFALGLDVIEHIKDDGQTLREIARVLEKGKGMLLLTVPAFESMWTWRDDVAEHERRYTRKSLKGVITANGFEIVFCSYYSSLLFPAYLIDWLADYFKNGHEKTKFFPSASEPLNSLLKRIFAFERHFLPKPGFPFGKSLICLCRTRS